MKQIVEYLILTDLTERGNDYFSFDKDGYQIDNNSGDAVIRIYNEPFDVINCRFVPIGEDRMLAINALKRASLTVQRLNDWIEEEALYEWLVSKNDMYGQKCGLTEKDIRRIIINTFGVDSSNMVIHSQSSTRWIKNWTNEKITEALTNFGSTDLRYYDVLTYERRSFAFKCWNKSQAKKSQSKFIDAINFVNEHYGYVCAEMVAEQMNISIDRYYQIKNKFASLLDPDLEIRNAKFIKTKNILIKSGESLHYDDKEYITKHKINKKSQYFTENKKSISRPTIDSHWDDIEPHFIMLNSNL